MEVWVVFQNVNEDPYKSPVRVEFVGVFDSREKAEAACRDELHLLGMCVLNDVAPHETSTDWLKNVCYPKDVPLRRRHTMNVADRQGNQ